MTDTTLGGKQRHFMWMLGKLITWAYDNGYELTGGELQRTDEQALHNYLTGAGIVHSLHIIKLAIDLNLFLHGALLRTVDDYRPLGEYWESIGGSWGGRFMKPDADHFSLYHDGVR